MRALLLALLLVAPLSGVAQDAKPAPYTEVESLRMENVRLEGIVLQREVNDWTAKRVALKADLEAGRPGWTWDIATGTFTKKTEKE